MGSDLVKADEEVQRLTHDLHAAVSELSDVKKKAGELRRENDLLQGEVADNERTIFSLERSKAEEHRLWKAATEENARLVAEADRLRASWVKRLADVAEANARLVAARNAAELRILDEKNENARLTSELAATRDHSKHQAAVGGCAACFRGMAETNARLKLQVATLQQERSLPASMAAVVAPCRSCASTRTVDCAMPDGRVAILRLHEDACDLLKGNQQGQENAPLPVLSDSSTFEGRKLELERREREGNAPPLWAGHRRLTHVGRRVRVHEQRMPGLDERAPARAQERPAGRSPEVKRAPAASRTETPREMVERLRSSRPLSADTLRRTSELAAYWMEVDCMRACQRGDWISDQVDVGDVGEASP